MTIAIKSEIDSRPLLYPLMRTLKNYGSMLVVSSNKQLRRLIDDRAFQSFRNITVYVDEAGATDDIFQEYGVADGDYDFVILDNMGTVDFDICFIPCGNRHSPEFEDDLQIMEYSSDAPRITFVNFGVSKNKSLKTDAKPRTEVRKKDKVPVEESQYDPSQKFRDMIPENKKVKRASYASAQYPTFQDIEKVEADHLFYEVPEPIIRLIHNALGEGLGVDYNQFRKEARRKDESSGNIKSVKSDR